MPKLTSPRATLPRSAPQKPTLEPCPTCGVLVLMRLAKEERVEWHNPRTEKDEIVTVLRWQELEAPVMPVLGMVHMCL